MASERGGDRRAADRPAGLPAPARAPSAAPPRPAERVSAAGPLPDVVRRRSGPRLRRAAGRAGRARAFRRITVAPAGSRRPSRTFEPVPGTHLARAVVPFTVPTSTFRSTCTGCADSTATAGGRRPRGPVLLVPGSGVRAEMYYGQPAGPSCAEYLLDRGYDVWVETWRASIDLPPNPYTLDHAAMHDHPPRWRKILSVSTRAEGRGEAPGPQGGRPLSGIDQLHDGRRCRLDRSAGHPHRLQRRLAVHRRHGEHLAQAAAGDAAGPPPFAGSTRSGGSAPSRPPRACSRRPASGWSAHAAIPPARWPTSCTARAGTCSSAMSTMTAIRGWPTRCTNGPAGRSATRRSA